MIKDHIHQAELYFPLHPLFSKAFDYLRQWSPDTPDGRYPLEGDLLYAMVQSYATSPAEEKKFEAHRRYIDIQYIAGGSEGMMVVPLPGLEIAVPYNESKDYAKYDDPVLVPSLIDFHPGDFAIYYPHDAHKPGCNLIAGKSLPMRKVVLKVQLADF